MLTGGSSLDGAPAGIGAHELSGPNNAPQLSHFAALASISELQLGQRASMALNSIARALRLVYAASVAVADLVIPRAAFATGCTLPGRALDRASRAGTAASRF